MMISLNQFINSRDNNFNLLRFLAALGVFISHTFPIAGFGLGGKAQLLGHVSVNIFFLISGFLVTKSLLQRDNLRSYFLARGLRVFPALIVAVLFTVFVVGLLLTTSSPFDYLTDDRVYVYWLKNSLLVLPNIPTDLPGLFVDSNHRPIANGPLWTLPYELACYVILAFVFFITRINSTRKILLLVAISLFIFCFTVYVVNQITQTDQLAYFLNKETYRLFAMFNLGVVVYLMRQRIQLSFRVLFFSLIIFLLTLLYRPLSIISFYLVIAYCVFWFAYIPKGKIRLFNRIGDYSYGIYIFAYPIQQGVAQLIPGLSLLGHFLISFSLTCILAFFSWHLIEARALQLKTKRLIEVG